MKKTVLLIAIFLLSFTQNATSQEYHPLLNNSSWILKDYVSCCRPSYTRVIEEGTDAMIGAHTYKRFNDPFPQNGNTTVYLREDAAEKRVYKIVNDVDVLLYDFNMEVGDVISQYNNTFTVTIVDYITVNDGSTRKRITLKSVEHYCGSSLTQVWIEGVGSNKHPFYPEQNMYRVCSSGGGINIVTQCSFQNGTHVLGDADCADLAVQMGINETQAVSREINFSPNPFTSELTIQSETPFQDTTIMVYNGIGQLVSKSAPQSGNKLNFNRGNLNIGLYFIQLFENGKLVKTGKVMIN